MFDFHGAHDHHEKHGHHHARCWSPRPPTPSRDESPPRHHDRRGPRDSWNPSQWGPNRPGNCYDFEPRGHHGIFGQHGPWGHHGPWSHHGPWGRHGPWDFGPMRCFPMSDVRFGPGYGESRGRHCGRPERDDRCNDKDGERCCGDNGPPRHHGPWGHGPHDRFGPHGRGMPGPHCRKEGRCGRKRHGPCEGQGADGGRCGRREEGRNQEARDEEDTFYFRGIVVEKERRPKSV